MLHAALAQQGCPGGPPKQQLCPIFYNLRIDECTKSDIREQYDLQPWDSFGLTEPKPEPEVLDRYAKDIQELCRTTNLRQTRYGSFVQQCLLRALPFSCDSALQFLCIVDHKHVQYCHCVLYPF